MACSHFHHRFHPVFTVSFAVMISSWMSLMLSRVYCFFLSDDNILEMSMATALKDACETAFIGGRWVHVDLRGENHCKIIGTSLPDYSGESSAVSLFSRSFSFKTLCVLFSAYLLISSLRITIMCGFRVKLEKWEIHIIRWVLTLSCPLSHRLARLLVVFKWCLRINIWKAMSFIGHASVIINDYNVMG